jgi:hypothetical protein
MSHGPILTLTAAQPKEDEMGKIVTGASVSLDGVELRAHWSSLSTS